MCEMKFENLFPNAPYIEGMWSHQGRWRARAGLAITCLAVLIVSCGNTGRIARADEPTTAPSAPAVGPVVLVDLGDPAAVVTWQTVNDPVMGGRSTSTVTFGDGGLVFSGNISLDNNGGFASARGPLDPEIGRRAAGATSLHVRALGDGKTYVVKVETGQPWSYIQRFTTEAGVRRTYDLPVGGFQSVGRFLDPVPSAPPLDPSAISRVSIYILDKQEGPFRLIVTAIDSSS
jgi:NADH dehydrogenase [ubiquinone] 1 alpha subcomplex assembly factor 1